MKKSILLLALFSFALIFVMPQVNASDRDVGYQFNLPVDNAVVVAIDQVVTLSFECITSVELRDPGDMRVEHFGYAQCQGLEAKSPDYKMLALSNGDLTGICSDFRDQHGTSINDLFIRYTNYSRIISTSNGGAGY